MLKKVVNRHKDNALFNLVLGVVLLAVCYGFGSWAIDSGSLWHYALSFVSFYFAVHYTKMAIKGWLKTNGKARAAGKAKG